MIPAQTDRLVSRRQFPPWLACDMHDPATFRVAIPRRPYNQQARPPHWMLTWPETFGPNPTCGRHVAIAQD